MSMIEEFKGLAKSGSVQKGKGREFGGILFLPLAGYKGYDLGNNGVYWGGTDAVAYTLAIFSDDNQHVDVNYRIDKRNSGEYYVRCVKNNFLINNNIITNRPCKGHKNNNKNE